MTRRGQLVRDDSNFPAGYNYFFSPSAATSGNIALKPGILHTLNIGTPASGSIQLYDGVSGATIANITTSATMANVCLTYDVGFAVGLTMVMTAGQNITVSYISADK